MLEYLALFALVLVAGLAMALHRARRIAEASEGRLRAFMEHSPNCVFLKDEEGRYVFMNPAAEALIAHRSWRGRTDHDLLPAATAAEIRAHDAEVLEADAPRIYDLAVPTQAGERTMRSVKFPLRDAAGRRYVGSITMDVTDERRTERELQFVTDTMSAAVIRCAADTRILWVNRVYLQWMGRRADEVIGRPLEEIIGSRVLAELRPHIDAVLAGRTPAYERLADYPGLGRRWVAASYSPTRAPSGEVTGWVAVVYDIHERKETQEQLGVLLDALPAAVLRVSRDEVFLWVNAEYARWLGVPAADIVGRRLDQVLSADQVRALRPYIEHALAGEVVRYERLARLPGLGARWVRGVFTPMFDGERRVTSWVVITSDVHEEKRMGEALREAQEKLQTVADAMPSPVILASRDLRFLWINRHGARWLAQPPEAVIGRPMQEVLGTQALAEIRPYIERVLAGEQVSYEREVDYPGSGRRWVSVQFAPAADDMWVAVITDIDETKRMEQALQEVDRRKDQFIATLAHELRNPLAPIRNAAAMLAAKRVEDPEVAWSQGVIERQVDQLARLVDDLLDVARISSGKLLLRREPVQLRQVLDMALETSRPHLDAGKHSLELALPAEPLVLDGDATRLAQVLSNLLINAAKYTQPGGSVRLVVEPGGGEVTLAVQDDGRGFPPEMAARIFEPFWQWAPGGAAPAGLGIGLSIVRAIVALHGGSVSASSAGPGMGARFEVRLPLSGAAPREAAPRPTFDPAEERLRVLVADDNRDAADSLSRLLELLGHEVRVAYDGAAALALAERFRPQAAVLDIGMPGANGYEVARELRSRYGSAMQLIALTGWGQDADRKLAAEAGFDHHLTKPVDPGALGTLFRPPA